MNKSKPSTQFTYAAYGSGKAMIEILNIGFEPLLTEEEYTLYKEIGALKTAIRESLYTESLIQSKLPYLDESTAYSRWLRAHLTACQSRHASQEAAIRRHTDDFRVLLKQNTAITRRLYDNREFTNEDQYRDIAIFESDLTRCFGCRDMEHSDDIISVVTYYTEIFDSIIHNGFDYRQKHYVFFTAGAGQTRCKKSTFVSEEQLNASHNRLFCGLSMDDINRYGGMNTNKYLAYTSLCQTNTEIWSDFRIDRAIVVDDIEFEIPGQDVRWIYTETPEDKRALSQLQARLDDNSRQLKDLRARKVQYPKGFRRPKEEVAREKELKDERITLIDDMDRIQSRYHQTSIQNRGVSIPFTDGFGISLKKMQSSMVRLPFIKGLMAYCPRRAFLEWCTGHGKTIHKITDIYGKSHSLSEIDYIFTRSQFKMWNYYRNVTDGQGAVLKTGWDVYKENFKRYHCDACRCNVEKHVLLNAKTNYQVLQTLTTEMTDEDILQMASYDINCLNGIGHNVQCMLNVLGANPQKNDNMNWLQKSLLLYPEMLKDFYVKTLLKNTKDSIIKKFRSGKFNINGAYTFVIPDTLACLQWWFTDMDKSRLEDFGFVKEGHVSCNLFEDKEEVDCLRSPHLDHAHCIRKNSKNERTRIWAKSDGIYVGMKDTMSKLLMYDNDGDKLLVHNNKTIIKCAKAFQSKYGMIPNFYDMPKASPEQLSNSSLFGGIVMAYHHGNIGTPSNEITKIWSTLSPDSSPEEVKNAMEIIALRCADVNFTIDFAKTLYKPTVPKHIAARYKQYSGRKVPHFFLYAKNKKADQVEPQGNCNIDRISNVVKSRRIVFKDLLGKYSYTTLMHLPDTDIHTHQARQIIALYRQIENTNLRKLSHIDFSTLDIDDKRKIMLQIEFDADRQREMFVKLVDAPISYIADVLVKALQDDVNKDTLWRLFGSEIYKNIEENLKNSRICQRCNQRFFLINKNDFSSKYCEGCKTEIQRERDRMKKLKKRGGKQNPGQGGQTLSGMAP